MLLKLALNRILLQKNKKRELNEVRRREIATLLADGKEDQARVKVMHGVGVLNIHLMRLRRSLHWYTKI